LLGNAQSIFSRFADEPENSLRSQPGCERPKS
jgi:hypothetical protein